MDKRLVIAEYGLGDISSTTTIALAEVKERTLIRCRLVGLTDQRLDRAIMVCKDHNIGLPRIIRYMENGITLERVELVLGIYDEGFVSESRASVYLMNAFANALGFSVDSRNEHFRDAIAAFQEFYEARLQHITRATIPLYWLYHRINEVLDGDFRKALNLIETDPEQMVNIVMRRRGALAGTTNRSFGRHCDQVMGELAECARKETEAKRRENDESTH